MKNMRWRQDRGEKDRERERKIERGREREIFLKRGRELGNVGIVSWYGST